MHETLPVKFHLIEGEINSMLEAIDGMAQEETRAKLEEMSSGFTAI